MAEIARRAVGEFEYRCLVAQRQVFILGRLKEKQREAAFLVFGAPNLDEPKPIAIES